ncbi:MAG TPA: cytochrome c [Candidatus Udaeobacter sp.]|jgi:mono/diheme cytochrome c family protein
MRTSRTLLGVVALATFTYSGGGAAAADSLSGKWLSPAPHAAKKNPIAPTQDSIAAGQKIYAKTCMLCHGKSGDADGPAVIELNIHPARLSGPQLNTEPDGALFWKITTGKKPMPAYGKRLSETDRWNLVNYIRTLPKRELARTK